MNEEILELWDLLTKSFDDGKYNLTLEYLNKYLNTKNAGINEFVLSKFIDCNIALKNYDEAIKILKLMEKIYKDTCNKFILAIKYIDCFKIDEAKRVIEEYEITEKGYYNIAKELVLYGEYELAKEYFIKCMSITDKEQYKINCKKNLYKINSHLNKGVFLKQSYEYFKKEGNKLEPGYVIYANISDKEYQEQDPVAKRRPYMIWKVIDDNLYCFPITKRLTNSKGEKSLYLFYEQNYINFNSDRNIKDSLVTIKESEITKVYEKIKPQDFHPIIKNIYPSLYFWPEEKRNKKKFLLDIFAEDMNVQKDDVIIIFDRQNRKKLFYYVLESNEKEYKVLELYNDREYRKFRLIDKEEKYISKDELIFSVIRINEYERSEIMYDMEQLSEKKLILK